MRIPCHLTSHGMITMSHLERGVILMDGGLLKSQGKEIEKTSGRSGSTY